METATTSFNSIIIDLLRPTISPLLLMVAFQHRLQELLKADASSSSSSEHARRSVARDGEGGLAAV